MGIRTLVGTADGTPAAAMYDSVSGQMIGPIWECETASEQIEGFLEWLRMMRFVRDDVLRQLDLKTTEHPFVGSDGDDPRDWPDGGLRKLIVFWRRAVMEAEVNVSMDAES